MWFQNTVIRVGFVLWLHWAVFEQWLEDVRCRLFEGRYDE